MIFFTRLLMNPFNYLLAQAVGIAVSRCSCGSLATALMETISVIVCCNFGQGYSGTSTAEYISGFVRWGERIYWDFVEEY